MQDEDRVLRKKGSEKRNSLSGKFRRARMAQRLGDCLNEELGEIALRVKMLVTHGRTKRPREALL